MRFISFCFFLSFLILSSSSTFGQSLEFPNSFTTTKKVPHGCLYVVPTVYEAPPSDVFISDIVTLEDLIGVSADTQIRIWRIGCHEPNRSAIVINFKLASADMNSLSLPTITLKTPNSVSAGSLAFLSLFSGNNAEVSFLSLMQPWIFPLSEQDFAVDGATFIIDTTDPNFTVDQYNDAVDLEIDFELGQEFVASIPAYEPDRDLPQFSYPPFNGRFSGQWTAPGLPSTGLVLQIGEIAPDRNFMFAIWFTYLNGEPIWVVGNADFELGASSVELEMFRLDNGEFITQPGSFSQEDLETSPLGTMIVQANHCNNIGVGIDFRNSGLGSQQLQLERLIRIAGYDCDQTQ